MKNDRYDTIMALLSRCSADQLERWVGKTETVIIDGATEEEDPLSDGYRYFGRCSFQAPEVDGIIYLSGDEGYEPGDVVTVEITGSDIYDLTGRILNERN